MKLRIEYEWCPETGGDFEHRNNGSWTRTEELDFGHADSREDFANILLTLADGFSITTTAVVASMAAKVACEYDKPLDWEVFWKSVATKSRNNILAEIVAALEKVRCEGT